MVVEVARIEELHDDACLPAAESAGHRARDARHAERLQIALEDGGVVAPSEATVTRSLGKMPASGTPRATTLRVVAVSGMRNALVVTDPVPKITRSL